MWLSDDRATAVLAEGNAEFKSLIFVRLTAELTV
jgi:hypothetical protein